MLKVLLSFKNTTRVRNKNQNKHQESENLIGRYSVII